MANWIKGTYVELRKNKAETAGEVVINLECVRFFMPLKYDDGTKVVRFWSHEGAVIDVLYDGEIKQFVDEVTSHE